MCAFESATKPKQKRDYSVNKTANLIDKLVDAAQMRTDGGRVSAG